MAGDESVLCLSGRSAILVYSHVLVKVVVPDEVLVATWIGHLCAISEDND
jgi:hypothetical protein